MPVRIDRVTVLPGDVVLGTPTGVIFVPPHLAERVAFSVEETTMRDRFGKLRLAEGTYTSGEIDVDVWREDIDADFLGWRGTFAGSDGNGQPSERGETVSSLKEASSGSRVKNLAQGPDTGKANAGRTPE